MTETNVAIVRQTNKLVKNLCKLTLAYIEFKTFHSGKAYAHLSERITAMRKLLGYDSKSCQDD